MFAEDARFNHCPFQVGLGETLPVSVDSIEVDGLNLRQIPMFIMFFVDEVLTIFVTKTGPSLQPSNYNSYGVGS